MFSTDRESGQTIIETVVVLFLLLLLILGIAEFARAWYVKNSLNNAARIGARLGAVTPDPCDGVSVASEVLAWPGVPSGATVTVEINNVPCAGPGSPPASSGDTVTVTVETTFDSIPGLIYWLKNKQISSVASMRYEL